MAVGGDITVGFGNAGNSLAFLGGGWASSELAFTWAIGDESHLVFPRQDGVSYILTLDLIPFVHLPAVPSQRLVVSVNGTPVGSADISRPSILGYRIPEGLDASVDKLFITLQHPDAARPKDFSDTADDRRLAFAVTEAKLHRAIEFATGPLPPGLMLGPAQNRTLAPTGHQDLVEQTLRLTGITIPEIALKFESLGENCEFGLFQRRCDVEPLGLLRFSSTFMRNLIRGIENGFAGIGAPIDIDPRLEGDDRKEYMVHERKYGLVYHTFVFEGQRSVWLMREQEAARLKFLQRKFMEELAATDKIFVYKLSSGVSEEEILPLQMALNRHSDATLLWVVPSQRSRPAGTVEVIMPGLFKGYIDRFAPDDNAHDLSFEGWLNVCSNAVVLAQLRRGAAVDARPKQTGTPHLANDDDPGAATEPDDAP